MDVAALHRGYPGTIYSHYQVNTAVLFLTQQVSYMFVSSFKWTGDVLADFLFEPVFQAVFQLFGEDLFLSGN